MIERPRISTGIGGGTGRHPSSSRNSRMLQTWKNWPSKDSECFSNRWTTVLFAGQMRDGLAGCPDEDLDWLVIPEAPFDRRGGTGCALGGFEYGCSRLARFSLAAAFPAAMMASCPHRGRSRA